MRHNSKSRNWSHKCISKMYLCINHIFFINKHQNHATMYNLFVHSILSYVAVGEWCKMERMRKTEGNVSFTQKKDSYTFVYLLLDLDRILVALRSVHVGEWLSLECFQICALSYPIIQRWKSLWARLYFQCYCLAHARYRVLTEIIYI